MSVLSEPVVVLPVVFRFKQQVVLALVAPSRFPLRLVALPRRAFILPTQLLVLLAYFILTNAAFTAVSKPLHP